MILYKQVKKITTRQLKTIRLKNIYKIGIDNIVTT